MPVLDEAVVTGRLRYRNCQPQPTAPKPASIQEVASRTLARQPDKNEKQRGRKGQKAPEWEMQRSRGKSAKSRQNWRIRQM